MKISKTNLFLSLLYFTSIASRLSFAFVHLFYFSLSLIWLNIFLFTNLKAPLSFSNYLIFLLPLFITSPIVLIVVFTASVFAVLSFEYLSPKNFLKFIEMFFVTLFIHDTLQLFSLSYRQFISSIIAVHLLNRLNNYELKFYIDGVFSKVRLIGFSMHGSQFSILIALFIVAYFLLSRYYSISNFRVATFCILPLLVLPFNGRSGIVCLLLILFIGFFKFLLQTLHSLSLPYSKMRDFSFGLFVLTLAILLLLNFVTPEYITDYLTYAYYSFTAALAPAQGDSFLSVNYNTLLIARYHHIFSWVVVICSSFLLSISNKQYIPSQLSFFFSSAFPIIFLVSGLKNNIFITPSAFMFFSSYIFTYFYILRLEHIKHLNPVN